MMSIENGKYYSLGKTGSAVWDLLDQPNTLHDICAELTAQFDVDPETCENDVTIFLQQLLDQNLISV